MESLKRDIFHIARSAEYFDKNELQAQTLAKLVASIDQDALNIHFG